ncbi:MAG: tetratricopeptide repeat protein, partial [Alphaproteobacteria bacterium]
VGREALALDECDAWARHAVAHVLEMNGRAAEGAAWLGASAERWKHTNNFGLHLYWHQALFLLELGRRDEVLGLYDQFIRAKPSDDFRDIANASALLARLEFEGVSVGGRWDELGEAAARRIDDRALVFADLHYALALAGAGRSADAERLGASLMVRGAEGDRYDDSVAQSVGISVAEAITAFRRGDHAMAAKLMWAVRAKMPTIGGSNAQRDLFEQLLIESLMRAGDYDRAETVLRRRLGERGGRNAFAASRLRRLADPAGIRYRLGRLITASMPLAAVH